MASLVRLLLVATLPMLQVPGFCPCELGHWAGARLTGQPAAPCDHHHGPCECHAHQDHAAPDPAAALPTPTELGAPDAPPARPAYAPPCPVVREPLPDDWPCPPPLYLRHCALLI